MLVYRGLVGFVRFHVLDADVRERDAVAPSQRVELGQRLALDGIEAALEGGLDLLLGRVLRDAGRLDADPEGDVHDADGVEHLRQRGGQRRDSGLEGLSGFGSDGDMGHVGLLPYSVPWLDFLFGTDA